MAKRSRESALVAFVQRELRVAANPAKAKPMAAYMRTTMPFYGVQKTHRALIQRVVRTQFAPDSRAEYLKAVAALWALPHREEKYLAIAYARAFDVHVNTTSMTLYRRMIVEGAWWDFVDEIAVHLVGRIAFRERTKTLPLLDRWIDDKCMWLRRTALIAQLTHKAQTDESRLFRYCLQRSHENEFFIRKAIGWTLREYSKTAPKAVARFVRANHSKLSPLSLREATRRLPAHAWPPSS